MQMVVPMLVRIFALFDFVSTKWKLLHHTGYSGLFVLAIGRDDANVYLQRGF